MARKACPEGVRAPGFDPSEAFFWGLGPVPLPSPVQCRKARVAAMRGGAPLPIPNREVKPRSGDDTAPKRGKVARRPPTTEQPQPNQGWGFLFYKVLLYSFFCNFALHFLFNY